MNSRRSFRILSAIVLFAVIIQCVHCASWFNLLKLGDDQTNGQTNGHQGSDDNKLATDPTTDSSTTSLPPAVIATYNRWIVPCPNPFYCDNGRCVPGFYRCDYEDDCLDGSDERRCELHLCNNQTEFRCLSGRCIPSSMKCDMIIDCPEGDDEQNCHN